MRCWQLVAHRRYLRDFTVDGHRWTAVLSWHGEREDRATATDACWLLRLGPGAPVARDVPAVARAVRFRPADLDRSTPTPPYLEGDVETMETQHALRTAERHVERELGGRFERLDV